MSFLCCGGLSLGFLSIGILVQIAEGEGGGYKMASAAITGGSIYAQLKHENGVHRVQRVPTTETQGRVHTSAASVVVMPQADEVTPPAGTASLTLTLSIGLSQDWERKLSLIFIVKLTCGICVSLAIFLCVTDWRLCGTCDPM